MVCPNTTVLSLGVADGSASQPKERTLQIKKFLMPKDNLLKTH